MSRLEQARAEIARRRTLAAKATPGPWRGGRVGLMGGRIGVVVSSADTGAFVLGDRDREARGEDAEHIAANDPAHVFAVLAAADATLDLHEGMRLHDGTTACDWCSCHCPERPSETPWPCPDAAAVLDLYAPLTAEVKG